MTEEYRRFNKRFEVSNLGNVKKDGENITPLMGEYYLYVLDGAVSIRVHTMVGECFPEICGEKIMFGHYHHLNHNKLDNRAENIRSISNSEHKRLHQIEDGVSVAVKAYDKEGNLVGKWDSKTQAAEATGVDYRHITEIILGKGNRHTAGGLYWFREDEPDDIIKDGFSKMREHSKKENEKEKETLKKVVLQIDENGSILNEWNSVGDAAFYYGITQATIYANIRGITKWVKTIEPKSRFVVEQRKVA